MAEQPESVVIVGAGLAGATTAETLRNLGYDGPVTLFGDESDLPYNRPPLSKSYLANKSPFDDALVQPPDWYDEQKIELRRETEVTAVLPTTREVELGTGERLQYGALVLATGSEPRTLPIPGAQDALYLRRRRDSERIRETFGSGKRLAIVGAGWIGLEVAAAARDAGTEVTVLEAAELPLLAVMGPEMARVFADLHIDHGVDLRLSAKIAGIRPDAVTLADGSEIHADAVVIGVGARPRLELAEAAGLKVDNGVLVDASLRTSDPAIFAVGDIANHDHPVLERRIRVEHWANALNQPKTAAAALLGGDDVYDRLPYFFSDQYDLGMEYIGYAGAGMYDRVVVRGDVASREFVAFWLDGESRMLAAMNVNVWDVPDQLKPLIASKAVIDADKLADPQVDYAQVGK